MEEIFTNSTTRIHMDENRISIRHKDKALIINIETLIELLATVIQEHKKNDPI